MNTDEHINTESDGDISKETFGGVSEVLASTDFDEVIDILPSTEVKDILPALETPVAKEEIKN